MTSQSFYKNHGGGSIPNSFDQSHVSAAALSVATDVRPNESMLPPSGRSSIFTLGGRAPSPSCMGDNYIGGASSLANMADLNH